ncbi:DUF6894 family protein [Sphingomonas sp. LHG3443-2]|uniref:DUF6894 family protein n=1 Tax=Sphingomonas sp. LHG3443-2 TaxID=2804639 RepID=UPI003CF06D4B
MPRYFLHLRDATDELLDGEGIVLAGLSELREHMLRNARDVIAGDVQEGVLRLSTRIEAEDESGTVVLSLPFTEAVTIEP